MGLLENILSLIFSTKKDPKDSRDFKFKDLPENKNKELSNTVNLTNHFSNTMNQGRLGSCVGCAGTNIMQYYENIKTNSQWSNLSEQYLYWEAEKIDNHPGQGTYPKCVMQVLKNKGIPLEKFWPYSQDFPLTTSPLPGADKDAGTRKIASYYRITTLKQLLKAIKAGKPVLLTLTIFSSWSHRYTQVIDVDDLGLKLGLHAVVVCGYDMDTERILIMNSWGTLWGVSGTAEVTFEYFKKYKQDCWCLSIE